ncbi:MULTISPECIES: hypothetical protein [unclassified Ruegeria]|uniref:hypothetical protein n=1 Tax=unclassified Ruegeria TaxID=2625375 RepID=UPI001487E6E6|nr:MULTISPECIES: hypothetical protein [unclassified Ruegeria]NOD64425.1 hypothetical protein [Ruegeria sp. HKCCD6109]NOD76856.1 hypothetical protein [Ruegeria sp. HKCCD4332]NOD88379.1 hypothetical protein [Ruegeria sp. HKCCD4318]NOE13288.1 hypothetical protein [Ruegeria sp. HKCCD4318-2]NOG11170.1 hypothetical protein [Ruegeria sp. HKCCD4315]
MEAFNVLLVIAFVLGSIFILMNQAKKAREIYGFNMVFNWTFVLVVLSLGTLLFGALMSNPNSETYDPTNALVLKIATVALVAGAGFINVRRSTVGFGIWFTFLQYVAAIGIIVPIFVIFSQIRSKGVLSNMTR